MRPRERALAIAVGVLFGGWFLDAVAIEPAVAWLGAIGEQTRAAAREAGESKALVDRQARILANWRGRHAAGLLDDEGAARFKAQQVLAASARSSGFSVDSVGGGQLVAASRDQAYDLVRLTVSGQGTLAQAAAFVAGIEAAAMPLRIERCEFAAGDPRQDRLDVAITVSTRIAGAAAQAGRAVPAATPPWQPEPRDASLDAAILAARPFLSDRSRPRATAVASEEPAAPGGWALVGIVAREPGAVAFLRELSGSGERLVRPGDALEGGTVTAVDAEGLHLRVDGSERLIAVGNDLSGKAAAMPASRPAAGTAKPATTAPPTASAPTTAPATPAATPAPAADADREAILQRLRQQRNRNQ